MSSDTLTLRVASLLEPLVPINSTILIGLSGGVDSVVLLHLLKQLAPRFGWEISALHVHHGISPNAGAWGEFCAELCARLSIPLHIERVDIKPLRKHGIEAAARMLRHQAFAEQASDFIAYAHHADDQSETLMLQLLRGAGVRGASAMPVLSQPKWTVLSPQKSSTAKIVPQPGVLRPLLHSSRKEVIEYANHYGLSWIEDESNADVGYPRNFLRHSLFPLLEQKFPAYRDTLSRSATHFAEASELLDDLARLDAPEVFSSSRVGQQTSYDLFLPVSCLKSLSLPRAKNLLRYFLHVGGAPMPQAVQLDDMLNQLCHARLDAAVCVRYGVCWEVHRYQGNVYLQQAFGEFERPMVLSWQGESELDWPPLNRFVTFNRVRGTGISIEKLQRAPVTLRVRTGGEALRPHTRAANRSLRNLMQERHVFPWLRDRLPLVYCGEKLVCVTGVAIDAEFQAQGEEEGVLVSFNDKTA